MEAYIYEMKARIRVRDFCLNDTADKEEGKRVYEEMAKSAILGYEIILDFKYVKNIKEAFFIEILENKYSIRYKKLRFDNLSLEQKLVLSNVVLMFVK